MVAPLNSVPAYLTEGNRPFEGPEPDSIRLSGKISEKELRSLARRIRSGHLGPTSVYYAGVTAPAIAAGMASLVAAVLSNAGWDNMAIFFCSAIVAAMAGISWYLIFMRLSYRHKYGRATELRLPTEVEVDDLGVFWTRGAMTVRIQWAGIAEIKNERRLIHIKIADGDDVLIPRKWFSSRAEKKAVFERLCAYRDRSNSAEVQAA